MAGFWFTAGEFNSIMGETIGYKSGLAISRELMKDILLENAEVANYFTCPDDYIIRLRSEVLEEIYYSILYSLGAPLSPLLSPSRREYQNILDLDELFSSEKLRADHNKFFDQRYIDYLDKNFERIDNIHWRQFEALTAEYFERLGYIVELGPGRNDDGVDIRLWDKNSIGGPPLILVQCKRQKAKIEKVVIKALWADIIAENATSGLIVTTASLSLGSQTTLRARAYTIDQVNRITLRKWIEQMRTPGSGVFLGY